MSRVQKAGHGNRRLTSTSEMEWHNILTLYELSVVTLHTAAKVSMPVPNKDHV